MRKNATYILVIASLCSNACRFYSWGKGSEVHKRLPRDLHHPDAGLLLKQIFSRYTSTSPASAPFFFLCCRSTRYSRRAGQANLAT